MIERIDVRIDVTDAVGSGEILHVAATLVLMNSDAGIQPRRVLFGYPGGGYTATYFDLQLDVDGGGAGGYSQAAFHASQGDIFVACDHLGVGGSDVPKRPLDLDAVARANASAAAQIIAGLRSGTLADGIAPQEIIATVAMGQSYGGFLLTLAQAGSSVFDGVAFLGWSGIETVAAWPKDTDIQAMISLGTRGDDPSNPRAHVYHWPDVPRAIVNADLTREPGRAGASEPWGAAFHPGGPAVVRNRNPLDTGAVASEAAALNVPVLVVVGEIDVVRDLLREATAYVSSPDVTLCRFSRMGHMHNFSSNRAAVWHRVSHWCHGIEPS